LLHFTVGPEEFIAVFLSFPRGGLTSELCPFQVLAEVRPSFTAHFLDVFHCHNDRLRKPFDLNHGECVLVFAA
jgi:hypothetical protein